jgi:hypothetical protein
MRRVCYIIGAGLTKALETDRANRVPLMWDFVSVLADHIASDVVLTTLTTLEVAGAYEYSKPEWKVMAKALNKSAPPADRATYATILRRRPAENIERLLQNAYARRRDDIYADTVPARFSFAINDVFARIGWNVRKQILIDFLWRQFALPDTTHTFINYNYDLVLDSCVREASGGKWSPVTGYGVPFQHVLHVDEAGEHMQQFGGSGGAYSLLTPHLAGSTSATSDIRIVKPHGSLNWAAEFEGNYHFTDRDPLLLLRSDGAIAYYPPFDALQVEGTQPGEIGFDAALMIVPPQDTAAESSEPAYLSAMWPSCREALESADDILIIGWSMPFTDKCEVKRIGCALAERTNAPRVAVVNLNADYGYFMRVAEVCGVPVSELVIFNDGFADFASAYSG